jgi:hypothetical protein
MAIDTKALGRKIQDLIGFRTDAATQGGARSNAGERGSMAAAANASVGLGTSMSEMMKARLLDRQKKGVLTPDEAKQLSRILSSVGTQSPIVNNPNYGRGDAPGAVSTTAITNANYGRPDVPVTANEGSSSNTGSKSSGSSFSGTTSLDNPNRAPMTNQLAQQIMSQMAGNASNAVLNAQRVGGDMLARASGDAMGQIAGESFKRGNYGQGAAVQAQMAQNETNLRGVSEFAGKMAEIRSAEQQDAMGKAQDFLNYSMGQDQTNLEKSRFANEWYKELKATNPELAAEIRDSELGSLWGIEYSAEEAQRDKEANSVAVQQNSVNADLTAVGDDKAKLWDMYAIDSNGIMWNKTTNVRLDPSVSSGLRATMERNLPGLKIDEDGVYKIQDRNVVDVAINNAWKTKNTTLLNAYANNSAFNIGNYSDRSGEQAYADRDALVKMGALDAQNNVVPGKNFVSVGGQMMELRSYTQDANGGGYTAMYVTSDGKTRFVYGGK